MKLINSLYYLINEINLGTDKMLPLITIFQKNGDLIRLYSTIHQSKERHGSETLKQIKKRYHDNELKNPVHFDRVGVPNHTINDNLFKIFLRFNIRNNEKERIGNQKVIYFI